MKTVSSWKLLASTVCALLISALAAQAQFNPPGYLSLDGNGDYAMTMPSPVVGTNPISISVWCKMRHRAVSEYHTVINTGDEIAPYLNEYLISYVSIDRFEVGTGNQAYKTNVYNVFTDVWYHVVAVYNGSSSAVYTNGAFVSSLPYPTLPITGNMNFGCHPTHSGYWFDGEIACAAVWNRALSAGEVTALWNSGQGLPVDPAVPPYNSGLQAGYNFTDTNDVTGAHGLTLHGDAFLHSGQSAANLTNGLVLYFPFDQYDGTNVWDASGNGNHGRITGGAPQYSASGMNGGSYRFAMSDKVHVTTVSNAPNRYATLAAWVFAQSNDINNLVAQFSYPGYSSGSLNLGVGTDQLPVIPGLYKVSSRLVYTDSSYATLVSPQLFNINQWRHIVTVRDNLSIALYVDGVLSTNLTALNKDTYTSSGFNVGSDGASGAMLGLIDELRLYNRALSSNDVWTLYNSVNVNNPAGLIAGTYRSQMAGGRPHSVAIKSNGTLVTWGGNANGQLNITLPNTNFIAVAAGYEHSTGLKQDGSIVAWGDIGTPNATNVDVPAPNTNFVALGGGLWHTMALKADGSIVTWGWNASNQCDVPAPNNSFIEIAGGCYHSMGLKANGTIATWGENRWGQCNVPAPNTNFVAISTYHVHSLGLRANGSIAAWGYNNEGECNVPAPNTNFIAIATGGYHSLGLKANGTVVAWGSNGDGQCSVPAPNTNFVAIAAGHLHSMGLKADGTVIVWGANDFGQRNIPAPATGFGIQGSGVMPNYASLAGGTPVTITGSNLCSGSDCTNVTLCGVSVTSILSQSPTRIVVMCGAAAGPTNGAVAVYSSSSGVTTKPNGFSYVAAQGSTDITNGLVLYFPFDQYDGTNVWDASGNGNHGKITGGAPQYTAGGISGGAYRFAMWDKIHVNTVSNAPNRYATLTAWINNTNPLISDGTVAEFTKPGYSLGSLALQTSDNETPPSMGRFRESTRLVYTDSSYTHLWARERCATNQWHLLGLVRDNLTMTIYLDGIPLTNTAALDKDLYTASGFNVGADGATGGMLGSIDEVRLYNRALSAAEMESLFDMTMPNTWRLLVYGIPAALELPTPQYYGIRIVGRGATVTNSVPATAMLGSTQYVCNGWTGTGITPPSGTGTQAVFMVTTNATLTWNWLIATQGIPGPTNGLVLYYPFDQDNGSKTLDASGNNHTGTVSGATWITAGAQGGAYSFDGVDDYILAALSNGLSGSFTLSCWAKTYGLKGIGDSDTLIASDVPSYNNYWAILFGNRLTGKLKAQLYDGAYQPFSESTSSFTSNQWYFVTMVRDKVADKILIYVNGNLEAQNTDTTTTVPNYSRFFVGNHTSLPNRQFHGAIDEVRVYNRALSSNEVATLYRPDQTILYTLTISSFYGLPTPTNGAYTYSENTTLTNSVTTPDTRGSTQYVCRGWSLIGNAAASSDDNKFAHVLSLDGNGDYAMTMPSPILGTNPISMSVWFKVRTITPIGYHHILNLGDEISSPYLNEYNVSYGGTDSLFVAPGKTAYENVTHFVTSSVWYHAVAVYDGISNTVYTNGLWAKSVACSNLDITGNLNFGCHPNHNGYWYDGEIACAAVWNRTLSAGEAAALWNSGQGLPVDPAVPPYNSGLQAGYNFADTNDVTGGHGLTLHGDAHLVGYTPPNVVVLTLTNDATLTWLWTTNYAFNVSAGAIGAATGAASGWYAAGSLLTVTAVPEVNYHFAGWIGDVQGDANNPVMTLTMDRPRSIVALFAPNSYILTIESPHGTASPTNGSYTFSGRTTLTNSVSAVDTQGATQYVCAGWTVAGNDPGSWSDTKFPSVLSLDGNGDYAMTMPSPILGTNPISFSVWCRVRTNAPAAYHNVLNIGDEIAPYLNEYNVSYAGNYRFEFGTGNQSYKTNVYNVYAGTWYHLVSVYNGSSSAVYTNGAFVSSLPYPTLNITGNMNFGCHPNHNGYWYDGEIACAAVWNRALSAGEVTALWNSGQGLPVDPAMPPYNSGLQAGYNFTDTNDVTGAHGLTLHGDAHLVGYTPPNVVVLTLTNDATLTWLWTTNYAFSASAGVNGTVAGAVNGWYPAGTLVTVTALPDPGSAFLAWTGDVPPALATNNPLTLTMNQARSVTALFNTPPGVRFITPTNGAVFPCFGNIPVSVEATDAEGSIALVCCYVNGNPLGLPDTAAPYDLTWFNVPAGVYTLSAQAWDNLGASAMSAPVTITVADSQPWTGAAWAVPGTFEAEDFDAGGEGHAYHDTTRANEGGCAYRPGESVDILAHKSASNGRLVGYTRAGEWLNYTINVASTGVYTVELRIAAVGGGGQFHLEVDRVDVTGAVTVPDTGGWYNWQTVRKTGINLSAGIHVLRLVLDAAGRWNQVAYFDQFAITPAGGAGAAAGGGASAAAETLTLGPQRLVPYEVMTSDDGREGPSLGWAAVDGDTNTVWSGKLGEASWWLSAGYNEDFDMRNVRVTLAEDSLTNLLLKGSMDATNWFDYNDTLTRTSLPARYLWLIIKADQPGQIPRIREIDAGAVQP